MYVFGGPDEKFGENNNKSIKTTDFGVGGRGWWGAAVFFLLGEFKREEQLGAMFVGCFGGKKRGVTERKRRCCRALRLGGLFFRSGRNGLD